MTTNSLVFVHVLLQLVDNLFLDDILWYNVPYHFA